MKQATQKQEKIETTKQSVTIALAYALHRKLKILAVNERRCLKELIQEILQGKLDADAAKKKEEAASKKAAAKKAEEQKAVAKKTKK